MLCGILVSRWIDSLNIDVYCFYKFFMSNSRSVSSFGLNFFLSMFLSIVLKPLLVSKNSILLKLLWVTLYMVLALHRIHYILYCERGFRFFYYLLQYFLFDNDRIFLLFPKLCNTFKKFSFLLIFCVRYNFNSLTDTSVLSKDIFGKSFKYLYEKNQKIID